MTKEIKYIEKVEIKGLWNKFDIEWNLNKDVNILSGGNGSGKSTILKFMYGLIASNLPTQINDIIIEHMNIYLNNKESIFFHQIMFKNKHISEVIKIDDKAITEALEKGFNKDENTSLGITLTSRRQYLDEIIKKISIGFINTFDSQLKSAEDIKKLSDNNVQTALDWEIHNLQTKYWEYQLNISKRKDIITDTSENPKKDIAKIRKPQNDFLSIMDTCFAETNKKINREKNEISFLVDDTEITAYQLSSGEKQLLIILLKTLIQDNKQSILFLDEPEISLHIDWQKQLIGFIRQLNPNVQIIMATHSPAMIMNGWLDKVFNVSDLIVPKSKL